MLFRTKKYFSISFIVLASTAAHAQIQCPANVNDGAALTSYRDNAIEAMVASGSSVGVTNVRQSLRSCFPAGVPSCLKEVEYHATYSSTPSFNDDSSGESRNLVLNSERDLPPEFLVRNSNNEVVSGVLRFPPNLMQLAKQKGWKAVSYKTRSTGGFDTAPNLTIVAIPGATKDTYLQISPPPDNSPGAATRTHTSGDPSKGQNTLTVISVDKSRNPPVGELRLMHFDEIAGGYRWQNNTTSQSCISCHTTPLRPISPIGYLTTNGNDPRLSREDERTVTEINEMMQVRNLSWGHFGDPETSRRRGPSPSSQPLGWAPPASHTRDEAFIRECSSNLQPVNYTGFGGYSFQAKPGTNETVDWRKISQAMNCVKCHNGEVRGTIHEGYSPREVQFKVLVDRSMPAQQGFELNMSERLALLKCLNAERAEVAPKWKTSGEWMRRATCGSSGTSGVGQLLRRRTNNSAPASGSSQGTNRSH